MIHRTLTLMFLFSCLPAYTQEPAALIRLARAAVIAAVNGTPPPVVTRKSPARPVFVTIERNGRVVGCRGGLDARTGSLQEEIIAAAQSAAIHDPRYRPMTPAEARSFLVTVTIVDRQEPLTDVTGLQPSEGLVLRSGSRVGIVLPWEGKDPTVRLRWARRKAGVPDTAPVSLWRLIAERHRG